MPDVAHVHTPPLVAVDAIELAAIAGEAAVHGWKQGAGGAVDPINRPALVTPIERAQGCTAEALGRKPDLVDAYAADEQRPPLRGRCKLVPIAAALVAAAQAAVHHVPRADKEIEVVRFIDVAGDRHDGLSR